MTADPQPTRYVPLWGRWLLSTLFAVTTALVIYVLIELFPSGGVAKGTSQRLFWGWTWHLTGDQQLIVLVVLAGAVGALLKSLVVMGQYMGKGQLKWGWALSYAAHPVAGSVLAFVLYVLTRAGFVNFDNTKDVNVYGYLAVALLTGLFASQAMGKLKAVADSIFIDASPPEGTPGGDPT